MAGHVYHWKHGWIPLDHAAADLKAHGDKTQAHKLLVNAEVAKVAAGEKDVKHAQRTIDHAHGYAGKKVSELSDNQLKHEQLRAKDMHRFATGEEDKRTALAHHKEVQAELAKRGHKTGRSALSTSERGKVNPEALKSGPPGTKQKPAGKKTLQDLSDSELAKLEKHYSGDRTPIGTRRHQSILAEQDRRDLKTTHENFRWGVSDKVDQAAKERAKNFREGDRVVGYDQNGNRITGRLSSTTQARLKKARPFPGQKPFDTPGPRYDNTWMIKKDDGGLVRVAPHSVDKIGDNPDSRPASGSNVRGGLADLGRLQSSKPSHVKAAEQIKGAQEADRIRHNKSGDTIMVSKVRPGDLVSKQGYPKGHPKSEPRRVISVEHGRTGGGNPRRDITVEHPKTGERSVIENVAPNSALNFHGTGETKVSKVDRPAGKQVHLPPQNPSLHIERDRGTFKVSESHFGNEPSLKHSIPTGESAGYQSARDSNLREANAKVQQHINEFKKRYPEGKIHDSRNSQKPEHVRAAEQFAGAKAEADRRRAGQTEGHNPFKAVAEGDATKTEVSKLTDEQLKAEQARLRSSFQATMMPSGERRLRAVEDEIAARKNPKVTGAGSERATEKLAKQASAEPKVKEKRVVGAPAGHQLIDTGKKSAGGSNNVIELRTDTGHTVGTLERVDREVPRRTGAIATSFKKETSWRLTYPGQSGSSPEYSYEKTRARAAADLLRRANPGKAAGR